MITLLVFALCTFSPSFLSSVIRQWAISAAGAAAVAVHYHIAHKKWMLLQLLLEVSTFSLGGKLLLLPLPRFGTDTACLTACLSDGGIERSSEEEQGEGEGKEAIASLLLHYRSAN